MTILQHIAFGQIGLIAKTRSETLKDIAEVGRKGRLGAVLALTAAAIVTPGGGHAGVLSVVRADGYQFTNFDPTLLGRAVGSNANGISNAGQAVGAQVDLTNTSTGVNYVGTPNHTTVPNTGAGQTAFGINSAGDIVGGNGASAFFLPNGGGSLQTLITPPGATNAFGINDGGAIVGQYTAGANTPGFYLPSASSLSFTTVDQPTGAVATVVNAQGVNNKGLIVGFYLGNDGQVHGFDGNIANAIGGTLTGMAIADPTIPPVSGEPGATFVFSQVLGVNDAGMAAGYYGDSTTSQHGFLYNTKTHAYTFVDDPAAAFVNGVEVTQITGINNSGEIAGFYIDASGAHSFIAQAVPEPRTWAMMAAGFVLLGWRAVRGKARAARA